MNSREHRTVHHPEAVTNVGDPVAVDSTLSQQHVNREL
jgi:hypothetical protein